MDQLTHTFHIHIALTPIAVLDPCNK